MNIIAWFRALIRKPQTKPVKHLQYAHESFSDDILLRLDEMQDLITDLRLDHKALMTLHRRAHAARAPDPAYTRALAILEKANFSVEGLARDLAAQKSNEKSN